jgi:lysine 6-dehydrogenase
MGRTEGRNQKSEIRSVKPEVRKRTGQGDSGLRLAVVGAGMMGRAVAFGLARQPDVERVLVCDQSAQRLRELKHWLGSRKVLVARVDAGDDVAMAGLLDGCRAAVSCVPYFHNLALTRAAIAAGCPLCDLGGNNDVVREQFALNARARRAGITVVPDCGLAPGLVSVLAADAVRRLGRCRDIRIRVGGLPRKPKPPLFYRIVFSANGLINEYAEPCLVLKNGRRRTVPALADVEALRFPGFGRLEAFNTSGGSSTLPDTLRGRVRNLDYKTIRFPGHCAQFRLLFDLGLASGDPVAVDGREVAPRAVLVRQLERTLGFETDDVVLLRVDATGAGGRRVRYSLVDFADRRRGLTAMMRCTGFPAALVGLTLARGEALKPGVVPGELALEPRAFVRGLQRRGLRLVVRSSRG